MNNSNKKRLILLALTLIMCLGVSYAAVYFIYFKEDSRTNELQTGLISINYQEGSSVINLEDTVPVIDEIGLENDPYQFSVKNTSKIPINLKFELIPGTNSQIPAGAIRYGLYINDEFIEKGSLNKDDNTIYLMNNFKSNETISAKLILWVDYYYENPGETFSATIKVTGESFDIIYEETAVDVLKSKLGTGGFVAVNTDGDLYDVNDTTQTIREYRYSGPTVDNYAYFNCQDTDGTYNYGEEDYDYKNNCEIWRIIGIFNNNGEEKIKLVRNTMLQSSEMPTSYVIDGTTYTIKNGNYAYWNKNDSGSQLNDWTKAGLQYYLNTEVDETDTSDGTAANAGYLSLLSEESKALISPTTYYLGNVDYDVSTVKLSYNQERDETRKWTDNQASWDGLVGLMYPSDYGYSASNTYWETDMYGWNAAESDGVYARSTSWMYSMPGHTDSSELFLSPSSFNSHSAMNWYYSGIVSSSSVYISDGARPVLNLKSQTKILKGEGTSNSPYVVIEG